MTLLLRALQSWRLFKNIRIRSRSVGIRKTLGYLRFQYASSTHLIRSCYASHDPATVELPLCQLDGIQNRFYYASTTADAITVKILKFGTPQTIAIIVLKIEKFDVTLH